MSSVRLAVISDLHADGSDTGFSYISTEPPTARANQHPLIDLFKLDITADYLIVPGDVTNRADHAGLSYAWRRLHQLANHLKARLISIPGNHDVVTHSHAEDRREMLKNLLPTFPTGDPRADDDFWRRGWMLLDESDHRLLLLDSTIGFPRFPQGVDSETEEFREYLKSIDRGSLTTTVEDDLENLLDQLNGSKINILLVHHHPQEHQLQEYLQDEYGPMFRGGRLLDTVSNHPAKGRWIVIHGHKHVPQLVNAVSVTSNGPLVLCAASAGARLWPPVNTITRNQIHILTATDDEVEGTESLRGTVESYTWGFGKGWYFSDRQGSGLPPHSGFGCAQDFRVIASRIENEMTTGNKKFIDFDALVQRVPQIPYLLPRDFDFLEDALEEKGFEFRRSRAGRLTELIRKVSE
jgi:predicted MPP superfamily phosphohydrolase